MKIIASSRLSESPFASVLGGLTIAWAVLCTQSIAADVPAKPRIDFQTDVRPIFNQHCVACHGGVKQAGDLSFAYGESVANVLEAGDANDSMLIERILLPEDDEQHMPPVEHGRSLSESEIAILKAWINDGAVWGKHWAYEPPRKANLAASDSAAPWGRTRTDRFVLSGLSRAGLTPEPESKPSRWLRRVSLDLIGLPPTPEQTRQFLVRLNDHREQAYAEEVERLLASPEFGQRWASVWLDVIRYADSRGLGADSRRSIWQFRDWVIRAFNADMPYDLFTIRQLAGDLLPDASMDDVLATACHRTTQTNEEGGTDDETFRIEAVMDRVNTTWQAWQGISFGCVQCHSHPYDPIEHREYYEFLSYFNNTSDSDLGNDAPNLSVPLNYADFERARTLDQAIDKLWTRDWERANEIINGGIEWKQVEGLTASTNNSTQLLVNQLSDGRQEYETTGTVAKSTRVILTAKVPNDISNLTALRFTGLPKDEAKARIDSEWGFMVSAISAALINKDGKERPIQLVDVIADEPNPLANPRDSLNPKSSRGFGAYSRIYAPRTGVFVFDQPISVNAGDRIRVSLSFNTFEMGAFPLIAHRGRIAVTDSDALNQWRNSKEFADERAELSKMRSERRSIRSASTPILQERSPRFRRESFLFDRGNMTTKTDRVEPSTPGFLAHGGNSSVDDGLNANRLQMARWIASPENPLTSRVIVNRIWAQLFGTGIVETQEDFGVAGARPSHPELLDDLAYRFQTEMGWSIKALLRELVLSASYRQSSVATDEKISVDPANRLISRGPSRRLPAETVRDQALAVAGLLDGRASGPPVHPPIPAAIWNPFQGGDKWTTPSVDNGDRYRRTVFTYIKRTIPYPIMASFDAPSREFCSTRRLNSNTPLQALMTLNDATFVEASRAFAKRMRRQHDEVERQISFGFRLATNREPVDREREALMSLYERSLAQTDQANPAEVALEAVAAVILNLDEVLTQ